MQSDNKLLQINKGDRAYNATHKHFLVYGMKKINDLILVCIALFIGGCTTIHKTDSSKLNVIQASEIISAPEKYQKLVSQEISEGKELVIFFKKGQSIPFSVNISLPVVKLETESKNLVFTRDTYLLMSQSKMRLSPDGQRWSDIYDIESQKELFGFNTGEVSVGFYINKNDGPVISVSVITK